MRTSKSAVFLFELMVIILVFTIAAAICTSIFAAAYNMSHESEDLTMSTIRAQSVAENFRENPSEAMNEYYDDDWEAVSKDKAIYSVVVEDVKNTDGLTSANVVVYKEKESFFSIPISIFEGK
jgi:hypothetical protein